ncbi:MAG: hypothetical protein LC135_05735 [Phycisphaerae bacterium]|nr:hypothetical protein [Phycisphaerae bacterium]MCZ2399356.1 hypothetical protein [Phycisphaerae bacterium]NUQ50720.1 hypothetical protein [Phycisphaerae bacterium]
MKSWEVLRNATERVGVKALAARLNLSAALVYKWCQESPGDDPTASGARNPLDRIKVIYDLTGDADLVNWICHAAGGFFVKNPQVTPGAADREMLGATQRVVQQFGELLASISRSIENDGVITTDEAEHIRQHWEALKMHAEKFVTACEQGLYRQRTPRG